MSGREEAAVNRGWKGDKRLSGGVLQFTCAWYAGCANDHAKPEPPECQAMGALGLPPFHCVPPTASTYGELPFSVSNTHTFNVSNTRTHTHPRSAKTHSTRRTVCHQPPARMASCRSSATHTKHKHTNINTHRDTQCEDTQTVRNTSHRAEPTVHITLCRDWVHSHTHNTHIHTCCCWEL